MTPLSEARADAVICRSAARALRRGDNPRDVARFIATYCGVVIPIPQAVTLTHTEHYPVARTATFSAASYHGGHLTITPPGLIGPEITGDWSPNSTVGFFGGGTAPIQDGQLTIKKPRRRFWPRRSK